MSETFKGGFDGRGFRVAVVVARFNDLVTSRLADGCREGLLRYGVQADDISWAEVPGARELPVACRALAVTGRYDSIVAIGCVVRGQTAHFEYVAGEASRGLGEAATQTGVPVIFAVLTTDTMEQALDRAGGKMGNKGWEAAVSAVEMADLLHQVGKGREQ
jgi:6,7-dimethyl-8-ribityllumazine synthase